MMLSARFWRRKQGKGLAFQCINIDIDVDRTADSLGRRIRAGGGFSGRQLLLADSVERRHGQPLRCRSIVRESRFSAL